MEERKWDYRSTFSFNVDFVMQCISVLTAALVFGFAAALLEGLPVIGLLFTLSNRIGAAMWAHGRSFILAVLEMLSLIYRTIQTLKNANILSQPSGFAIDTPLGQMRIHKHCRPSRTQKLAENCFPFFAIMTSHTFELYEYDQCRIFSDSSSPKIFIFNILRVRQQFNVRCSAFKCLWCGCPHVFPLKSVSYFILSCPSLPSIWCTKFLSRRCCVVFYVLISK